MNTQQTYNELVRLADGLPERIHRLNHALERINEEINFEKLAGRLDTSTGKNGAKALEKQRKDIQKQLDQAIDTRRALTGRISQLKEAMAAEAAAKKQARQDLITNLAIKFTENRNLLTEAAAFLMAYKAIELEVPVGQVDPWAVVQFNLNKDECRLSARLLYDQLISDA